MRFSSITAAALIGGVSATFKFGEQEALAAAGVFNIGLNAALHGYPSPETCTLKNVAVRREWYVSAHQDRI
jgi:tyrosinase